ncbi:MAG: hypothetical protein KatS3mg113_0431 [Planctomycetaceae bacterium]|nr:MAG: hypothetical protein KatS3mg113_0431 [Planctomycetaceae bacterium]
MSETQKTYAFIAVAVVSMGLALIAAPRPPKAPPAFEMVGQEFYPQFTEPDKAQQLQVIAYNSETAEARIFSIEYKDGKWRIPSHHNYPADAKDRLARCAASLIGLKRGAVAGYRETDHPQFEVVDPLDEKSTSLRRGQRITLRDSSGNVLVDYIIGKQVPNRTGFYYIRRPDEKVTYTAKISLDLSTKFADWIEPDLLKVDSWRLNKIVIDNYSVDLERGRIVGREQNVLTKKSGESNWQLEGLNAEEEEVNQDEVRKLVNALDDLRIVGVRPKPPRLQRDLKLDEGLQLDDLTRLDLQSKGFYFARTPDGNLQMVSREGDVTALTDQGVQYQLHFGEVFSGTDEEIELGFTKSEEEKKSENESSPQDQNGKTGDDNKSSESSPNKPLKKSRYLFVTAHFNPEGIGSKPEEPTKPSEPGDPPADPEPQREADSPASALELENVGPWAEYREKKRAYEAALADYETKKKKYDDDLKSWEEKRQEGEKKVQELNARFADWYYVISGESFENLRQGRKTLVKSKTQSPSSSNNTGT